jgi:hypothetical protein
MDLQPFDILFYKGDSFISKLIKKETGSQYSHVALVLDDKHLVEIDRSYNLKINHIGYSKKDFDVYRIDENITRGQHRIMMDYVYKTLNSQYDYVEIIDILLLKAFNTTLMSDQNKFICSTWINACFSQVGIQLSSMEYPTPQDLISDKIYLVEQ